MDAACYGLNQELDFWAEQHKPVMMSEYGADTVAGLHTAGAEMFSEEFQVEFYRRLDAEFDKRPWFVGEFVWNFADYDTVQGPMRVDGNKKGLFTRDRRPKLGMHFLRQRWAEIPTFGFKEYHDETYQNHAMTDARHGRHWPMPANRWRPICPCTPTSARTIPV